MEERSSQNKMSRLHVQSKYRINSILFQLSFRRMNYFLLYYLENIQILDGQKVRET